MISESDIEKALSYLRSSVEDASQAKSDMVLTEGFIKVTKANLMASSGAPSVSAQEVLALSHKDYKIAVEAYAEAVRVFTYHQMKRESAIAWVEAWRSQEASNRANDKSHR